MKGDGVGGGGLEGGIGGGSDVEVVTVFDPEEIGKAEVEQVGFAFGDCYQYD